ncbi:MAG: hypothetical protein H6625_10485 [Bdellovibrionaceae bacterium]|nr:hypothetical protein [Pseudobdellovibrionaceae bacterium]
MRLQQLEEMVSFKMSLFLSVCSLLFLYSHTTLALDLSSKYQMHMRMGMFNGSYAGSGIETRAWSVPTTLDLELEVFLNRDKSFNLRSIMAMELSTNKVNYTYAGVGQTYYFLSRGKKELKTEKLVKISNVPKWRYYWGWNSGISQVLTIDFGLVLGTYSTTLDVSANTGFIYQLGENIGLEGQMGMGLGYGFSTVTVTGTTMRALVGIAYYF